MLKKKNIKIVETSRVILKFKKGKKCEDCILYGYFSCKYQLFRMGDSEILTLSYICRKYPDYVYYVKEEKY